MYVETDGHPGLLFHRLVEEHREILRILDELRATDAAAPPAEQAAVVARLGRIIRIHARAEEAVIFPVLDGSYELGHHVREDEQDHRTIDAQVSLIERRAASGQTWLDQLEALRVMLLRHFEDEEEYVFPLARYVLNPRSDDLLRVYELEREYLTDHLH